MLCLQDITFYPFNSGCGGSRYKLFLSREVKKILEQKKMHRRGRSVGFPVVRVLNGDINNSDWVGRVERINGYHLATSGF